ncbi:MAG TPA: hypothetical protein VFS07_05080 [Gemmatimonadales bacterium]|jgi:hypothetical protein|nr:hypothetical protein [Gemmatimonadales bacterium]
MPLPDPRDHHIPLERAAELTRHHRAAKSGEPHAEFFHRAAFERLLAQPGCAGIRVYRGRDAKGGHHLVLVGVDGNGDDMTADGCMEEAFPCPPYCSEGSPLLK